MSFRFFLQLGRKRQLPHTTCLCKFRGRLGADGFRKVFDQVIGMARGQGLVRDRLRIKDATHIIIADIAIPSTLALVAGMRDRLLIAAEPFARDEVRGERINIELLRESTDGMPDQERLLHRVTHLRDIVTWVDRLVAPDDAPTNRVWQKLVELSELAHKILRDQENPKSKDKTLSVVDPDARRSKHGDWYEGFMLDVIIDPDSDLITQINVLAANGEEALDAIDLIKQEEAAHGNDIESLSIDGAGFHGPMLSVLEDPDGLAISTFVPPKNEPESELFGPGDFTENEDGTVTCPAGQTSKRSEQVENATKHHFAGPTCAACAMVSQCMKTPPENHHGRKVRKNHYADEYDRVRARAKTEEYACIRSDHYKVERKLGEIMNRHGGRRARYRGKAKVLVQQLMAATATNIKRMIRLQSAPNMAFDY